MRTSHNGVWLILLPVLRHIVSKGVVRVGRTEQRLDAAAPHKDFNEAGCGSQHNRGKLVQAVDVKILKGGAAQRQRQQC